ncbi:MAG: class I SAM-dependent methyltransferase, partial [Bacteroidota bacterium]
MNREESGLYIRKITSKAYKDKKPLDWFEQLYKASLDKGTIIPWADKEANEHLLSWWPGTFKMNGKKALVVGCGLGDDAIFLEQHGFDVDAFDLSPTAIEIAKQRFTNSNVHFFQADLFNLPDNVKEYDFIFEAYTLQAMPLDYRARAIPIIEQLLAKHGHLLIICRGREEQEAVVQPTAKETKTKTKNNKHQDKS